jgi:hypothetical protein
MLRHRIIATRCKIPNVRCSAATSMLTQTKRPLARSQLAGLQKKKPLKIGFERQTGKPGAAPHLAQQLKRWLIEWADSSYNIYADGLVVRTVIHACGCQPAGRDASNTGNAASQRGVGHRRCCLEGAEKPGAVFVRATDY